ncbi:diguanylate cyclase [Kangiella marina]|uniref:diguanylate cyclase n=1 Tax=Kangiella marina TaxID=1079178 RepID=A0ABP8IFP3_9GAMM
MPLGGRVIKNLRSLSLVFIVSLLFAAQLFAASSSLSPIIELNNYWTLCIKHDDKSVECDTQNTVGSIESNFENFDGIAIYKTDFSLEESHQDTPLTLYIPHLRDADIVFLNGYHIAQTGQFPPEFEKATLYSRAYPLPSSKLKYGSNRNNELVISVYNHARQGGLSSGIPVIKSSQTITDEQVAAEGLLMFYVGIMLIIAAVQGFYFAAQPQNKDHLYFGLFCVFEAIYIMTYSHFAFTSGIHLNIIFRANILLFGLLTLLFFMFMTAFFKRRVSPWFKIPLISFLVLYCLSSVFINIDYIYHLVHLLQAVSVLVLIPFYVFLFYRAIKEKLPYAKLMATTLATFILAVLFDFLVDLQLLPAFMNQLEGLVSPIFLIAIFTALTLILIHKHWLYYHNATYDYLTNCLRRSAFIERLNEELHRIHRSDNTLVLALLDLDNFKQINDQYNHIMGDNILRAVATRTSDALREFDLLGRYGGDEFILAAEVSGQRDAAQLLKRVHSSITETPIVDNGKGALSVMVTIGGVTTDPNIPVTAEELIEAADEILIKGKVKQKGRVHI